MKDKTTAIILSALLGGLGVDRFYLGYPGMGVLKLLTGGCFGILWIIDIINIATGKLLPADGSSYLDENISSQTSQRSTFDPYDELRKISELRESGAVSEEEYLRLKKMCLDKIK